MNQKCQFSKSESRGNPQITHLKLVFSSLIRVNQHSIEEMLGDGKKLVCFDLFLNELDSQRNRLGEFDRFW